MRSRLKDRIQILKPCDRRSHTEKCLHVRCVRSVYTITAYHITHLRIIHVNVHAVLLLNSFTCIFICCLCGSYHFAVVKNKMYS